MRALFVGLGSIGTRHLRNLAALCKQRGLPLEVYALRSGRRPLPADTAALLAGQFTALPPGESWDLAFITGPTQLHAAAIEALKGRVGCFFIEKPIFERADHDLAALGLGPGQKAYVAAPIRHTALYAAVKARVEGGLPVYAARAICSSYLPGWRPQTDYRQSYSARRALGGGVTLDLIHEWDYFVGLFGPPDVCYNLRGHLSPLEIDSDDVSVYIARWPGLLGEIHLDYIGRQPRRTLELFSQGGTLVADFLAGTLTLPEGTVENHKEAADLGHAREIGYFLDYALGGETESTSSPERALGVLKIALGE